MKRFLIFLLVVTVLSLAGCGEVKDAVSGINSAANTAAKATSADVHSIRASELSYKQETFTVNTLFKTILKDVFWEYKEKNGGSTLQIKATWKEPLFSSYKFDEALKQKLAEDGDVLIELTIKDHEIQQAKTKVKLVYKGETLVEESGQQVMDNFFEAYIKNK